MLLRQRGTCATVWWSEYNFRTCGACAVTCNMISNWGSFVTPFNLRMPLSLRATAGCSYSSSDCAFWQVVLTPTRVHVVGCDKDSTFPRLSLPLLHNYPPSNFGLRPMSS